ncbi:MAG: metallopeptidase TldD-related protein [Acidobacteriota bacterium]
MKKLADDVVQVLGHLTAERGWPEAEVAYKLGRSRSVHYVRGIATTVLRQEEGWAVRAGDDRRSFYYGASGPPRADAAWPEADGAGLRLPSAQPVARWQDPADLDSALLGEKEAEGLIQGIDRALGDELRGARLHAAWLDDGSSELHLANSREVRAVVRQRTAIVHLEAVGPRADGLGDDDDGRPRPPGRVLLRAVAREGRRLQPLALARRLADRLEVARRGRAPSRDRGDVLLAPQALAPLIGALGPLWIGPQAENLARRLINRHGRVGTTMFTLIDDGRLPGGLLEAPVDGEGVPCREIVLVDRGVLVQPLLAWDEARGAARASGCRLRPGWRDLPRAGPTHLYLAPDADVTVAQLLGEVARGYYLIDLEGAPRVDFDADRFALPVCGFAIDAGRPTGPVAGAWLTGPISGLFNGLQRVARDLTFLPDRLGVVGAPTALLRGLELRSRP